MITIPFFQLLRMLPDASDRLKWTYGVSAFQQWCAQHNRSILLTNEHLMKSDLFSYPTGDDLQHAMSVFIREVRRPTGEAYLPESIYYLCLGRFIEISRLKSSDDILGIHFYFKINNRQIDLFDPRYVEFNSTLNQILGNYSPRLSPVCKFHSLPNSSLYDRFFQRIPTSR